MVAYNKYFVFVRDLVDGRHDFTASTGHVYKVGLTNTAPTAATNAVRGDTGELTTTGGYTAGGITVSMAVSLASDIAKVATVTNPSWTGSGSGFTFAHAFLYDSSAGTPTDPLVAYWSYGSSQLVALGETLTVDFDDSAGVFTVQ